MRKLTLTVGSALGVAITGSLVALTPQTGYTQALEEITVTARKTSESLQEIPLAITALGEDEITRLGINDLSKITQQDTSVQFDEGFTPSDTRITIRGLSPTRGRPNAATMVDGIDLTSEAVSNAGGSTLINPRLIDVERIEIVKGPQSALYGRSAFAGALQYITKDPSDVLSGEINIDANTEDAQDIRGNVSIPLTNTLGVLINGSAWDARGSYRNTATGDYVGGGDGLGGSITFKWEPTDSMSFKWRTEYSDDNFDVAPQTNLHNLNTLVDLGTSGGLDPSVSNLAPLSSNCVGSTGVSAFGVPNEGPVGTAGPLDNYDCSNGYALNKIFQGLGTETWDNGLAQPGRYDVNDDSLRNQYNKQVTSLYVGTMPDGDDLKVTAMPNYQFGRGATDPANAEDYNGVEKDVFRTSLVAEWAINDNIVLNSYTGYVDATVHESLDLGKYFIDECGSDGQSLLNPALYPNPIGAGSYGQAILDNNPNANLDQFAPCLTSNGPDGIHDGTNSFVQNSRNDTTQFSQEFRVSWDLNDSVNITNGLLYWKEEVDQLSHNSTTIIGGPECYIGYSQADGDTTTNPFAGAFVGLGDLKDRCTNSGLAAAHWNQFTYQGRLDQGGDTTSRNTDHYSWYGSIDYGITDKLNVRLEARFTREDNSIRSLVQDPCFTAGLKPGDAGCSTTPPAGAPPESGAGGQPTGPSAVLICGQVGGCDSLGIVPVLATTDNPQTAGSRTPALGYTYTREVAYGTNSYWDYGYQPMPGNMQSLEKTDRFWAPKATVEYFWNDDVMTYFSWSRGIKPGGFSLLTSGAFGLDANLDGNYDEIDYDSERLDVWEIGAKTTLFDGRVRLNGAAFYQDFKDKQVTVQAVVADTVGTKVENISGSEIRGLELDGTWQITENWRISGGYTYLDSEYTDYDLITRSPGDVARIQLGNGKGCTSIAQIPGSDPTQDASWGCAASFNGNQLERSPKHSFNATLNFSDALLDTGYDWYTEVNTRYQDSRYLEAFNVVEFDSYNISDWRIGIIADNWEVTGFIDNVFDDDTITTGGPQPGIQTGSFGFGFQVSPNISVNAGPKLPSDTYAQLPNPRTAGVRATFRFGG
ncbi:MAG: TonB-dependent receptor [Gammaproteobacteria bacterium]|nr:TonB-dependent receptor [Gammaproteobacteria bacterium]